MKDYQVIITLCWLHFLHHPLFPSIQSENRAPVSFEYETEEQIHCHTVHDFLEFSMKCRNLHLFRYLWSNWLRPFHRISGRWDLISIADCDTILHTWTTACIEQHWKLLKHKFMKLFIHLRMDLLIYIIIYHLFPFKRWKWLQHLNTRELPRWYGKFKQQSRQCYDAASKKNSILATCQKESYMTW